MLGREEAGVEGETWNPPSIPSQGPAMYTFMLSPGCDLDPVVLLHQVVQFDGLLQERGRERLEWALEGGQDGPLSLRAGQRSDRRIWSPANLRSSLSPSLPLSLPPPHMPQLLSTRK